MISVEQRANGFIAVTFTAMASPCEVLLNTSDVELATRMGRAAAAEVYRIEAKYSRYRSDSTLGLINHAAGTACMVDDETAKLIDFAAHCHALSGGMFDITSGVLRKVWRFNGSDQIPTRAAVRAIKQRVGFHKINWQAPSLTLRTGMELDFGGIGKEYAADSALAVMGQIAQIPALVNLGGDLCCNRAPEHGCWQIGVERPDSDRAPVMILELASGALATSGDTHRFLLKQGKRYSHILNPSTGWPIEGGPRSVTVAAPRCIEAGMIATFALLQGAHAEQFLREQGVQYWCLW